MRPRLRGPFQAGNTQQLTIRSVQVEQRCPIFRQHNKVKQTVNGQGFAARDTVLSGADPDITSLAFPEFGMEPEENTGPDIDIESRNVSIRTPGQLYDRIFAAT